MIFWAGMRYAVWIIHCCKRQNFCISQGSIATLLRWDGQNYGHLCRVSSRCRTSGVGCAPSPENFWFSILKWRILMHISGILTYLFCSAVPVPAGTGVSGEGNFWLFNLKMARFDAHLRYSFVGLLILKFCCMCNEAEYMYMNTRQRTNPKAPRG